MKKLKQILIIINLKTVVMAALAVVSTYLCRRFEITADFPMTLIATAVVFPIVYSIGGAYKRRESTQEHLENLFDPIGEDDIAINAEKFVERLGLG